MEENNFNGLAIYTDIDSLLIHSTPRDGGAVAEN
jgi:hypothetical protein